MKSPGIFHIIRRSLVWYRLPALYQVVVIMLLSAIITGSILTGSSVRKSLKNRNLERIGNTGLVISSGPRFFPSSLAGRISGETGTRAVAITELKGWATSFSTGKSALNCQITATGNDFFSFHNQGSNVKVSPGKAVINRKLADDLDLVAGDEIIVRFGTISDIPADSPFSDEESNYESLVLTISSILVGGEPADFSLAINQVTPRNIFIDERDLDRFFGGEQKANRILLADETDLSVSEAMQAAMKVLAPPDVGLTSRISQSAGQEELISDRIFIDQELVSEITSACPGSEPLITYLANSISGNGKETPYSFISALPHNLYGGIPGGDTIVINRWLADDLGVSEGDILEVKYYTGGQMNNLTEVSSAFITGRVVDMEGVWGDETLMPEFPGISGMATCSRWEAGVPIDMNRIRQKDEDYWYEHHGTPKAFISYKKGKSIWGNNFGPATAIRFPEGTTAADIEKELKGHIDPARNGFTARNAHREALEAASNSVDFTSLFMSLGFFIIISSLILLSLVVHSWLDSRKEQVMLMRAVGFRSGLITRILFFETSIIAVAGSLAGILAGVLFNRLVIVALNSVWKGAVQTNTLTASADAGNMAAGFISTLFVVLVALFIWSRRFLRKKVRKEKERTGLSRPLLFALLIVSAVGTAALIAWGIVNEGKAIPLYFGAGTLLFAGSFVIYLIALSRKPGTAGIAGRNAGSLSWRYYISYPSRALTPVIFIAAGLFIVVTTGANRKSFNTDIVSPTSGTGGYIIWGETAAPLLYDLNTGAGREQYALDTTVLSGTRFIQGRVASGNDASCLNLNQVKTPPLLGIDAGVFADEDRFSFATKCSQAGDNSPWNLLRRDTGNIIYGIIDQTVLQWGMMRKTGDTLVLASESGEPLKIIIAGGLNSSVFQGYIIIGSENFTRLFPSVAGSNVFMLSGVAGDAEKYLETLSGSLKPYGCDLTYTWDRLAGFNQVSNTYLTVFMTLGGLGMLIGIIGMAFILLRNFNLRKKEYALLLSAGFTARHVRRTLLAEHFLIMVAGVLSGSFPAIVATLPSLSSGNDIPWRLILIMIAAITAAGSLALMLASHSLVNRRLIESLRSD